MEKSVLVQTLIAILAVRSRARQARQISPGAMRFLPGVSP
jgi:hypothetical protein